MVGKGFRYNNDNATHCYTHRTDDSCVLLRKSFIANWGPSALEVTEEERGSTEHFSA